MKSRAILLLVFSFWSVTTLAAPIWCGGSDSFQDHPLQEARLEPELREQSTLLDGLVVVRDAFKNHVEVIGVSDGVLVIKMSTYLNKLTNPEAKGFNRHAAFNPGQLDRLGFPKPDCNLTPEQLIINDPGLAAIYSAAASVFSVGRRDFSKQLAAVDLLLQQRRQETEAWLLTDGLAQWPWELWLNGKLLTSDVSKPTPKNQFILLRPSLGLNLSYPRQEDADITPTGVVEILGMIRYRDRSYKKHWGLSLLADIDSDKGAGVGLGFRWNGYWAGYVAHADERPDALYVGIDLASLLQSKSDREAIAGEFVDDLMTEFSRD